MGAMPAMGGMVAVAGMGITAIRAVRMGVVAVLGEPVVWQVREASAGLRVKTVLAATPAITGRLSLYRRGFLPPSA